MGPWSLKSAYTASSITLPNLYNYNINVGSHRRFFIILVAPHSPGRAASSSMAYHKSATHVYIPCEEKNGQIVNCQIVTQEAFHTPPEQTNGPELPARATERLSG